MFHSSLGMVFAAAFYVTVRARLEEPSALPCCLRTEPLHSTVDGVFLLRQLIINEHEVSFKLENLFLAPPYLAYVKLNSGSRIV